MSQEEFTVLQQLVMKEHQRRSDDLHSTSTMTMHPTNVHDSSSPSASKTISASDSTSSSSYHNNNTHHTTLYNANNNNSTATEDVREPKRRKAELQASTSTITLTHMPNDVIVDILSCLSVLDMIGIRRTCRILNECSHHGAAWSNSLNKIDWIAQQCGYG